MDNASDPKSVSVIVPTHERMDALRLTLEGIAAQTLPTSDFEVIVVDDGSQPPLDVPLSGWPFHLTIVHQARSGATAARNAGAERSSAEVLVFVDDDITLAPDALAEIASAVRGASDAIVVGQLHEEKSTSIPSPDKASMQFRRSAPRRADGEPTLVPIPFTNCMTGFLAIRSAAFHRLGGFEDPTGGWPSWDDVDFGYRAHMAGIPTMRAPAATAVHRDAAQATFELARDRWWRAAHSAVALFERHPGLLAQMPMFTDKLPVDWRRDSGWLVVRKLLRRITSMRIARAPLSILRAAMVRTRAPENWVARLEAILIRAAVVDGYRTGLRDRTCLPRAVY